MALRPLEVTGVDAGSAPDATADWLRARVLEHKLVVLRNQRLTPPELAAFARRLGAPERFETAPDSATPEVLRVTNREEDRAPPYWHSDGMMQPEPPSLTLLYAERVPAEGGGTLFLDAEAAYDDLPDEDKRRLAGLRAVQPNGVEQPIVRTHPETGRKALYLDLGGTVGVTGIEREAAVALFTRLRAHYDEPGRIYRHRARAGDLLVWDNASTSHSATPPADPDAPRVMLRVTLRGGAAG